MAKKRTTIYIVGLGNPGEKFKDTRHNIGREILYSFQEHHNFPEFIYEKKWNALVSRGIINSRDIILILPESFMNKSGTSVERAMQSHGARPASLFVIHDEADIPLGRAKISLGKRAAGHKGVESVMRALHTRDFLRFRIGIAGKRDTPAENLVLKKWRPDDLKTVRLVIKRTIEALGRTILEGAERAMNEYNA